MKKISSQDNKIYKTCIQLGSKKYRDKLGKYIIEGPNLVREALDNNVIPEILIISQQVFEMEEIQILCRAYLQKVDKDGGNQVFIFEDKLFSKIIQTENSQGILGIVEKFTNNENLFFNSKFRNSGNVLVLDRLQDPGNVGTVIRTADAAGYSGILIIKGTVDVFSPKVVRACTGSLFRMPILFVDSPNEAIQMLKDNGKRVVSTGFDTDKYYYEIDLTQNIGLVIGNEGNGICDEFKNNSDEIIKIPMFGNIESLNASVAAALLMYETMRK
ncbi:MAG: TrmH family RNA methyltransferase [Aminipila sp.]